MTVEYANALLLFIVAISTLSAIQTVFILVLKRKATDQAKSIRVIWRVLGEHLERTYQDTESQIILIQERLKREEKAKDSD